MRILFCSIYLLMIQCLAQAQTLSFKKTKHQQLWGEAWRLALWTIDTNTTKDGLLKAGAGYGGEWARDASMNSWNAASLLRPKIAEFTLWSVTKNRDTVAHQYWDKIVWVIAAEHHARTTGNETFKAQAIVCAKNTIAELEAKCFNSTFNLFTGPGNINDGIAAYPEPIFEPNNMSSYVLDHKLSKDIMVLSTNLLYMQAYYCLSSLLQSSFHNNSEAKLYAQKADNLKAAILEKFYNPYRHSFYYIIYPDGSKVNMQEGLGYAYALLFNILNPDEASKLIANTYQSKYGIVNVYPHFPRYTDSLPGRHNNMVWAFINAYWGTAMAKLGRLSDFKFELDNQAHLALDKDKGNHNFEEVANALTGAPDGGWQSNRHWSSKDHQTWNATGYCNMITKGMFGINVINGQLQLCPVLPKGVHQVVLSDLKIQDRELKIILSGKGTVIKTMKINGQLQTSNKEILLSALPPQSVIEIKLK